MEPSASLFACILVPLDFSPAAEAALAPALALARCGAGQIVLAHVVELGAAGPGRRRPRSPDPPT